MGANAAFGLSPREHPRAEGQPEREDTVLKILSVRGIDWSVEIRVFQIDRC